MPKSVITEYEQNITLAEQQIQYFSKQVNRFSVIRLLVFGALLVLIYWAVKLESLGLFGLGFLVLALLFNWLVSRQSFFEKQKLYFQNFKAVNQNELDSITSHANLYDNGSAFSNDKHFYTSDLDIFGPASLYQLINRGATSLGTQLLASWLNAPANKYETLNRQLAVQELSGKNSWKLKLQAQLLFARTQDVNELPRLFSYLRKPVKISGEAWLRYYVKAVPFLMLAAIIIAFYISVGKYVAVLLVIINRIITSANGKVTDQADLIAGKIGATLNNYADVFATIEQEHFNAELNQLLAGMVGDNHRKSTSAAIKQLSAHINNLNARLMMIVGFLLNAFAVWNVRCMIAIENWKRQNHQDIEAAFEAVAGFEALLSLTSLHINNSNWCMPDIAEGDGFTLTAIDVAHPLIKPTIRVANTYELINTRKVDIITGSNMAGKSTFLRTLGINTVLALAGAPVCAHSMQVSVMQLFSYMRIKDSLNESTSTFKAELDRLQMLLQAVKTRSDIFFLIDEMLRGTNSVDKYLGSKAVIEQLIARQGVGLVATHDLQLAQLEQQYPDHVRNYYFDIQILDGEMLFDYKLKPGECKTFNASLLLERIGIFSKGE